jgi:hypothetical protein
MKPSTTLLAVLTTCGIIATTQAASVLPGDIPNNVSPTFTTADSLLTITGYSDSFTTPANLTSDGPGTWFGVEGGSSLNTAETLKLELAPDVGLSGFGDIWTRAVITISGFTSDPGFTPVGSPAGLLGSSYDGGTLTVNLDWNGGTARDYILSDLGASAGQTLLLSLDAATSPQWAVSHLDYAAVPEPAAVALVLLGATMLVAMRRIRRIR